MQLDTPIGSTSGEGLVAPRLMLSRSAWYMLCAYVAAARKSEVSGFAYVQPLVGDPRTFYVETSNDVFIVPQEVTIGSAEISGDSFALAAEAAVAAGRDDQLRLQWHSHPAESYFSATDLSNIEGFGAAGMEWCISLVTNRDNQVHARFDAFRPVRFGVEMEVVVYDLAPRDLVARAERDVADMVTVIEPEVASPWPGLHALVGTSDK